MSATITITLIPATHMHDMLGRVERFKKKPTRKKMIAEFGERIGYFDSEDACWAQFEEVSFDFSQGYSTTPLIHFCKGGCPEVDLSGSSLHNVFRQIVDYNDINEWSGRIKDIFSAIEPDIFERDDIKTFMKVINASQIPQGVLYPFGTGLDGYATEVLLTPEELPGLLTVVPALESFCERLDSELDSRMRTEIQKVVTFLSAVPDSPSYLYSLSV